GLEPGPLLSISLVKQPIPSSPAKAGDPVFSIGALEYWVARSSRAMTTEYDFAISPHQNARGFQSSSALQTKGAGKTGCALHPRSRVQRCASRKRTRAYR